MKTGEVQDPGTGAEPYLETNGWTPWLYHAPEDEIERYYSLYAATALARASPCSMPCWIVRSLIRVPIASEHLAAAGCSSILLRYFRTLDERTLVADVGGRG